MHLCVQAPVEFLRHCVTGIETCICLFSSRRRHTRSLCDWSSDVCSSDLKQKRHTRSLCDWSSDVCSSDPMETHAELHHSDLVCRLLLLLPSDPKIRRPNSSDTVIWYTYC